MDIHFAIIFLAKNKIKAVDNFLILPFISTENQIQVRCF
jgi:hypothetical protein